MPQKIKSDKPPKTFSVGAFFGGLILSYILFAIVGAIEKASPVPLFVLIIGCAAISGFAVLTMAHAIEKDEYWQKSAAIGVLGLIIGLIAERLLKGVKEANSSEYTVIVLGSWTITTVLVIGLVLLFAVIFASG